MDETSIYLNFSSNYTYEKIGTRRVKATTSCGERVWLSAAFTESADSGKSKIYIIVPRATELPNYVPPDNVVLKYKTGGTFNDELICNFMEEIISDKAENSILILDSVRCHLTSKVSQNLLKRT